MTSQKVLFGCWPPRPSPLSPLLGEDNECDALTLATQSSPAQQLVWGNGMFNKCGPSVPVP